MKITILHQAETELTDAINFYNHQFAGLGDQFYFEIMESIDTILRFPEGWKKVSKNTRRFIIKRFPYSLLYVIEANELIVTSIAHQHRLPASSSE